MDDELFEYVSAKVAEIAAAPSASADTRKACKDFADAIATGADRQEATDKFADAITVKQTTVDDLIAFAGSETGKQVFGEQGAAATVAHTQERKAAGARWCDCAACRPCHELLTKLGREEADVYL